MANLKLANWFLGVFAPELQLTYDKKNKKLLQYQGVSNIKDDSGSNQDVTIRYQY